jgi:hypothetical protein
MMVFNVRMLDMLQLEYYAVRCDLNICIADAVLGCVDSGSGHLNTMRNIRIFILMYGLKILHI